MGIFQQRSKKGKVISLRPPTVDDAQICMDYINTLSKEKTFILFQGEQLSLEEEKSYLESRVQLMTLKKGVTLLAFYKEELIGIVGVEVLDKVQSHIGVLGLSIAKAFRGEGIGSLLLDVMIEKASQEIAFLEIVTLTVFSHNIVGLALYKSRGFTEYGKLPRGIKLGDSYVDEILMYKKIHQLKE